MKTQNLPIDTASIKHHPRVVTYLSPRGNTINICPACETALKAEGKWPKDWDGQEFCSVTHGLHMGFCVGNPNTDEGRCEE